MARSSSGPITKSTESLALGYAQIRIGESLKNIKSLVSVLTEENSIGSLVQTDFANAIETWKHSSGFPLKEDLTIVTSETASFTCQFEEITPFNMALASGKEPWAFTDPRVGEFALGTAVAPAFIRMEAVYTFPDGKSTMTVIFPRAQVSSSTELALQADDSAKSSMTFESKRADEGVEGGDAVWNNAPLGKVIWEMV